MTQSLMMPTLDAVKPSEESAIANLTALIGRQFARELWCLVVTGLNLKQPIVSPAELRQVAEMLMTIGDASRVTGRTLRVEVIMQEALAAD